MREEDVSAEQPEAQAQARLPRSDAHARRSRVDRPASVQGPAPSLGLIWRIRDRDSFAALAAARRHRRGALSMSGVAIAPGGPPRVAYAIGRSTGNAVVRNRIRRRLRAALQADVAHLRPGAAYLVGAGPAASEYTVSELHRTLRALVELTNASMR